MDLSATTLLTRVAASVLAGGSIGLERTFHGRAAGFRTHALVCVASALLMVLTEGTAASGFDPLRTVQGIMTGIGFLGAGVIIKEGASIRGLTTAASIWITAAIGIAVGSGSFGAAALATVLTLVVLVGFRWIEKVFPSHRYGLLTVRLSGEREDEEGDLRRVIHDLGGEVHSTGFSMERGSGDTTYRMILSLKRRRDFAGLMRTLRSKEEVLSSHLDIASQ